MNGMKTGVKIAAMLGLTTLALVGCTAPSEEESAAETETLATDVLFTCDNDVTFEGTFVNEEEAKELIVIFPEAADPITLPLVPAASGSQYNDGDLMIWIKGDEALVERAGEPLYIGCMVE
jgi:membrane-bound inhibitor of C-type lysozyme